MGLGISCIEMYGNIQEDINYIYMPNAPEFGPYNCDGSEIVVSRRIIPKKSKCSIEQIFLKYSDVGRYYIVTKSGIVATIKYSNGDTDKITPNTLYRIRKYEDGNQNLKFIYPIIVIAYNNNWSHTCCRKYCDFVKKSVGKKKLKQ